MQLWHPKTRLKNNTTKKTAHYLKPNKHKHTHKKTKANTKNNNKKRRTNPKKQKKAKKIKTLTMTKQTKKKEKHNKKKHQFEFIIFCVCFFFVFLCCFWDTLVWEKKKKEWKMYVCILLWQFYFLGCLIFSAFFRVGFFISRAYVCLFLPFFGAFWVNCNQY